MIDGKYVNHGGEVRSVYYAPIYRVGALSDDARLTSV